MSVLSDLGEKTNSANDQNNSAINLFIKAGAALTGHTGCIVLYTSMYLSSTSIHWLHDALHSPLGYLFLLSHPLLVEKGIDKLTPQLREFGENKDDTILGKTAKWLANTLDCHDEGCHIHDESKIKEDSWFKRQKEYLWRRRKSLAIGYFIGASLFSIDLLLHQHTSGDGHFHEPEEIHNHHHIPH